MKTRIIIKHPNGESMNLEAEKFILAFKEDTTSPLNFHVKMFKVRILINFMIIPYHWKV